MNKSRLLWNRWRSVVLVYEAGDREGTTIYCKKSCKKFLLDAMRYKYQLSKPLRNCRARIVVLL